MAPFKAHSVRFYELDPIAIQCLELNEKKDLLAVARSTSAVEVWNVSHAPILHKYIPGSPQGSIENLCWYEDRLFSCGLHGFIHEYDLEKLNVKAQYAVTSGPAWCMASNKSSKLIASGTEEGFVCIFSVLKDSLEYLRILDKQEGRILCLSWNPAGTMLVTGSIDTIRVWNARSGHPTARMTTGRVERNKETIVWSVAVTEDLTVISGDSRGRTCFWNGENGTLIDNIQSHKADVLSVNLNENGTTAYSSGVDPTIMHFQLIRKADKRRKWVKSLHRVLNKHDVRALVSHKDRLISGGVDAYITVSNHVGKSIIRVPPIPRDGISEVASNASILLFKYRTYLELWRLGETDQVTGSVGSNLSLSKDPLKLLQLHSKDNEEIMCSTISKDSQWVAYATPTKLRVYRVEGCVPSEGTDTVSPSISRIKVMDDQETIPLQLAFFKGKDGDMCLMTGTKDGDIKVFSLSSGCVFSCWSLLSHELKLRTAVSKLAVNSKAAIVSDYNGNIVKIDLLKSNAVSTLPSYTEATLCSMDISRSGSTAVFVYSNQHVLEVDLKTYRYTSFSSTFNQKIHKEWSNRKQAITGVNYLTEDLILLHDDEYLAVINKDQDLQEPESKLHIVDGLNNTEESQDGSSMIGSSPGSTISKQATGGYKCLRLIKKYHHLVGVHHLKDNAIACIEVGPEQIEEKLPPSLVIKKYGAR